MGPLRRHRRSDNQSRDFLPKTSWDDVNTKSVPMVEDLSVHSDPQLPWARFMANAGESAFRRLAEYKDRWYASQLVITRRFYPSGRTWSA